MLLGTSSQLVGACAAWLPRCVEAHARFSDPDQQAADAGGEDHRRVADTCSGLQHNASEPADRDLRSDSGLVDEHERAIEHVEFAVFEEDDTSPILHRNRA